MSVVTNTKQPRFFWKCLPFSPVLQQTLQGRALDQKPVRYFCQFFPSLFLLNCSVWLRDKKGQWPSPASHRLIQETFFFVFFPPHQKLILDARVKRALSNLKLIQRHWTAATAQRWVAQGPGREGNWTVHLQSSAVTADPSAFYSERPECGAWPSHLCPVLIFIVTTVTKPFSSWEQCS